MARVHNNIFVRGLTGSVGDQFVIRKTRSGKTIIANKPAFDENREFTAPQMAHQEAFRQATAYAKGAKIQPVYIEKAKATNVTPYNMAVADWFGQPEILETDYSGWRGQVGQVIRIKATDDTHVASVQITIQTPDGSTKFEQGQAELSEADPSWWVYTSKSIVPLSSPVHVVAIAKDLPGNSNQVVWRTN
jgi:hypothetical protein